MGEGLPRHVHPGVADALRPRGPTCATPKTCSRSSRPCTAATTSPSRCAFYNATNAWNVSPTAGAGPPNAALPQIYTATSQGGVTSQTQRMSPIYENFKVPGQSSPSFNLVDTFVPAANSDQIQTMTAFITAGSDPGHYGQLTVFQTPAIDGPALVDADIAGNSAVSKQISLLNAQGSTVYLGTLQIVPVGNSMLYFRPFYVTSSRNIFPKLDDYIVVYAGAQRERARWSSPPPCRPLCRPSSR